MSQNDHNFLPSSDLTEDPPSQPNQETEKVIARRTLLKLLAASGGAVAAKSVLPEQWGTPLVEVGYLPAHAQTSPVMSGAPSFTSLPITTIDCDTAYSYNITTSDPDAGDTRTITATTTLPMWLTLTDNGDGTATLSGTPSSVSDVGSHTITLQVEDAGGLTDTQSFMITVAAVNKVLAYITNAADNTVSVIDTTTGTVSGSPIPVGNAPLTLAVTSGGKAYVANAGNGTVSVIDTTTDTVIGVPIPVGSFPAGVAVMPDGSKVYVTNSGDGTVSVIDTATDTVSATIMMPSDPQGVVVAPDGLTAYVAVNPSPGAGGLAWIDTTIDTGFSLVLPTVMMTTAQGVAVTPDGSKVYVTNSGGNTVLVFDIMGGGVTPFATEITVGNTPFSLGSFIGTVPSC